MRKTTTQCNTIRHHSLRLSGFFWMFLLAGFTGLQAQTVTWSTGYPELTPATLTVLDDPGTLDISFTPTVADITSAKLEVTLPSGISYVSPGGITTGPGHTASITYGTPAASGQMVTVSFTSNGNTLKVNEMVFIRLTVQAACSAVNNSTATVKVLSNTTPVSGGEENVTIGVQVPNIRVLCDAPVQNYATRTETKEFELKLDAQNGEASSLLLTLTGDQYTVLSDFNLDGTGITPATSNVVSGTTSKTTVILNTTTMGGKLGTTPKILKFKAGNSRCGSRNITTSVQYPATSNCATQAGNTLTMNLPTETGVPTLVHVKSSYIDPVTGLDTDRYGIPTDGGTPSKIYQIYQNTGTADAYDLTIILNPSYNGFCYTDTSEVYYSIDNGPEVKVTGSMFTINNRTANAAYCNPKPAALNLPTQVTVHVPDVLPVGKELKIRWEVIQGNIYDHTGKTIQSTGGNCLYGVGAGATANNSCGSPGFNVTSYANAIPYVATPIINELPQSLSFRGGESIVHQLKLTTGGDINAGRNSSMDVYIQLPSWMSLDGIKITDAVKFGNSDASSFINPIDTTNHGNGLYSLRYQQVYTGWLQVKLKGTCQSSTANVDSVATYWLNYNLNDGTDPLRPPMQRVSQVFQSLTMLCKQDGVVLDELALTRTTKGLKDSNNDSRPDTGGGIAPDAEIDHSIYMVNDSGYIKWKGTIVGTSATVYKNLYALLSSENLSFSINGAQNLSFNSASARISIDGTTYPMTSALVDSKKIYLRYRDDISGTIKGGSSFEIVLPFKVINTVDRKYTLAGECYVSDIDETDPAQPAQRHGEDKLTTSIGLYGTNSSVGWWGGDARNVYFSTTSVVHASHAMHVFRNDFLIAPYFKNEYRNHLWYKKVIYTMPDGYVIDQVKIDVVARDSSYTRSRIVAPESVVGNVYTYDFAQFYDASYDGSGTLTPGLWMLPDDKFALTCTVDVRATHRAPLGNSVASQQIIYDNNTVGGATNLTVSGTSQLIYSGLAMTLNLSTTTLQAYSPDLSIPVVTVGNPNSVDLNQVWLYVDGNVNNLSLTPAGGGTTVLGTGFEDRWIKVSDLMSPGSLDYTLNFTYGGSSNCSLSDKVKIYTVSGFDNTTWTPTTGASALDPVNYNYVGPNKELSITSAPASIAGSVSVSNPVMTLNTSYTVTALIDGRASQGMLNHPKMELTIPAGQKYVAGSGTLEYPAGTTLAFPPTLESALAAINGTQITSTAILLDVSSLVPSLPGYLGTGSDDDRQILITADFTPQCPTPLTGIRYSGKLTGENGCGAVATNNNRVEYSELMLPAVSNNYTFQVTGIVAGGNRAFNEQRTSGTYRVTLQKVTGFTAADDMAASDHLLITIPPEFNLSGTVSISAGLGAGTLTPLSNTIVGTDRQIELPLPVAAYNSDANKGQGIDVVYEIPLVYTPNGQTLVSTPEKNFNTSVITNLAFDASCTPSPAAIGTHTLEIAALTALENAATACLNTAKTLEITSAGFSGAWYDDELKTTLLSSGSTYAYTPASQSAGGKTFYVSAVFGSNDYGMAPVVVNMNPEATITVTAPAVQCSSTSSVNLVSTVSGTPAGSTTAFYSDAAGTTALGSPSVSPATTTTYYARVTTTEGCQSAVTPIVVTVNATPSLTAPGNQTVSPGTIAAISLNGTNATHYTWTGGAGIGLVDNSTPGQTQIPSFTAANSGTSPVTRTITVTPHNTANSVTCDGSAQTFTITVNPSISGGTFQNQAGCAAASQAAISATGAANVAYYNWSGGNSVGLADNLTGTSQTQIPAFTLANVTTTTIATVTVTPYTSGGFAGTATSFSITVHPRPTVTLSHNKPATDGTCLNTDVTFSTEPGKTNYVWDLGGASTTTSGGTTSSNTAVLKWNTSGTKTVTVNYTDANGCSATSEVSSQVLINPTPVAGTFSDVSVCTGATQAAITPSGGTSVTYYTWSGGASSGLADYSGTGRTQIPSFSATSGITSATTATITVVPHFVNGTVTCDGAPATFTLTVNPLPVITLTTNMANDSVCVDNDIVFTTESGMTGYIWNLGGATTTTAGGTTSSNTATLKWNTAGTKTVSVSYTNANGCTSTATAKTITVVPATAITTQPAVDPGVKLPNGTIIPGSNVELEVTASGANLSYQWYWKKASDGTTVTLTDGGKYTGATDSRLTIGNAYETENGNYHVTVSGYCGSETSTPVTVVAVANQDASLRDLKVNGTTLADFNPGKTDYILTVVCGDEQASLLGTPNNPNVTSITGNGTYNLNPGNNFLTITVTAQDMTTTRSYTVNIVRDCYLPKLVKDLEDAVICLGESHTFEISAEGEGLSYEWYYGNNRILGANSNTYTVKASEQEGYERYYVIVRSNFNGYQSSVYSRNVRLWVAEPLPETLLFADCPAVVTTGETHRVKLVGYPDVTKYGWSYRKTGSYRELQVGTGSYGENDGVIFSPAEGGTGENETWATFGILSEGIGAITATLEHPCGTREVSRTIEVKYPTGTGNVTANAVQVSPNPTSGIIRVSNTQANQTVRITDVTGSLKGTYKTGEGATTIDLTGYAKGTYLLQYNGKIFKVIKN